MTQVVRYTVVDDFGNLINPMLAEGQVHGGVAQGIGQALTEHVVYDEDGQLLTATFMDYAMPRADDVPMIGPSHRAVPSTANPMGMKGCGEAGTVGALARWRTRCRTRCGIRGVRQVDMPFTPLRVWGEGRIADAGPGSPGFGPRRRDCPKCARRTPMSSCSTGRCPP
jgi:carbon-monoxide dehydrogenase large subunit